MNENILIVVTAKNNPALTCVGGNCYKQPVKFSWNINIIVV